MKCRYCNAENPKQALKCNNCGNILDEETKPNGDMETVVLDASTLINIDPLSFSPGENFGDRYQIIEEIGQGGMGRVFKAKDMELNTVVALKMIKPQLSSDPSIVNRFKRELLLAREIIHEHVIRIHDLGEIKGIKYISMNYIQGNTIKEILQTTGKFTLEKSIDIIKQVCNALQAAHNKGIIHRDLKPQNIIIDKTGKAYVLDFGIAHSQNLDGEISEEGVIMGTPDYMAPEQIKGNKTTAATDIYSLGIILYEMLTGQLPFAAKNQKELLYKNLNELPTSPSEINPLIPVKLESIILKCMEKNERDRYQAISEILVDIELDKTVEIPPIKKLSINEKKTQRSFFKTLIWVISPFFVIYGLVSILSLVMDSIYHVKIEKLQVEYDTHYKNYFPIKKNWLPNQWEIKQCNSWEKYQELFSVTKKKDQFITSKDSNDNNLLKITYHDHLQLKKMLMQQKTGIKPIELSDALKCTELDPRTKENKKLDIGIILHHLDFKILEARLHFLERNYKQGLTILYHWMIFSLDLFTASRDYNIQNTALICYSKICIEMLPLFLSYEFNDNTLPPYKIECLSLFGNYKVGVLPNIYESPNQETRTPPPNSPGN